MRLGPEPENPHDRAAVRVEINGEHVGYIPRGKALPLQATAQVVKMGAFQAHTCGSFWWTYSSLNCGWVGGWLAETRDARARRRLAAAF